ncbi:MAG TPA: Flp pilus assembly protein CpaB [Candidatus Acidoferrales bacterium]|nr:Flp pilus assembly protein CpaB [Candidatus Acidoferrales bacterium]
MSTQVQGQQRRRTMPIPLLGVVLAVAGFVVVLMLGNHGGGPTQAVAATSPVAVAARNINIRTAFGTADVTIVKMVPADVPPGAFTTVAAVKGLVASVDIKKGQPVTSNLLVKSSDTISGPQAAYLPIPPGFVAKTIPTSEIQGVAGFIQPGDYISIIAVVTSGLQNTRTIYTNVPVIEVGPSTGSISPAGSASPAPKASGGVSSSLTVVVTECQAEYLTWFQQYEAVTYTLESFHDYQPQDAKPDSSCPGVGSAKGVNKADVSRQWPGFLG